MESRRRRLWRSQSADYGGPHEDTDEETCKGKRHHHHSFDEASLFLERLRSNPLASVSSVARKAAFVPMNLPSPKRRGQRTTRSLLIPLLACILIPWMTGSHRHSLRHNGSHRSLKRSSPLVIRLMFDHDVESSQRPDSLTFTDYRKVSSKPDYNNLVIKSLWNTTSSMFYRQIAPNDYEVSEKHRSKFLNSNNKGAPSEHYEEYVDSECQQQNWHDLHFPNCNAFHEFDLGRRYDPRLKAASLGLAYYDSFPSR